MRCLFVFFVLKSFSNCCLVYIYSPGAAYPYYFCFKRGGPLSRLWFTAVTVDHYSKYISNIRPSTQISNVAATHVYRPTGEPNCNQTYIAYTRQFIIITEAT